MAGFLGTVVDAAIGWMVQSILGSFFTGQMEAWTREVGLAEDVKKLKFEMRNVEMVLAAAEGRRIDNKPLARSLDDLKELIYDAEDVMDELDYYRLQQQIEQGKGCGTPTGTNPEGSYVLSSTPSSVFKSVRNTTSQITSWISYGKRKREEEGPAHNTKLTFEIKQDISERIGGIVNLLHSIGNSVQGALQLEISRPIVTSSGSQNIARNARMTTSVSIECNLAVPPDMNNLFNLRHLIANEKVHHTIACAGDMTSLQELEFKVRNVLNFEIRQLQSMNELVFLGISELQNVKTKEDARGAMLIDKEYLEKLSLSWEDSSTSLEPETAKDVLEGLQPHQNLKTLEITGYGGATSPTWLCSTFSVTSLQILHLEKCREWQILPTLEMPFLRKLTLIRMLNVMEISVPSLEEFILTDMPKLEKCIGSYGMELTSHLKVLKIKNCPQLNEFTLFQSYSYFDAEQKSWFPSLEKLSIMHCPQIMYNFLLKWELFPLREMVALKELELMDLHVVRELAVPSLEKLVLIKMPNLEICDSLTASPPLQFLPSQGDQNRWLPSLRRLTIHDCPCLTVSHPLPSSARISELSIRGVPTVPKMSRNYGRFTIKSNELTVLDDRILALHNLRGITRLQIRNCPNLVSLSSEAFSQLIALEYLSIHDCPNLAKSNIMSEVVQENSRPTRSLLLPSLKSLVIITCGITGRWLTQMLSQTQSLEKLLLTDCPAIKFLSISEPSETEGTSSLVSGVMTSAQDEHQLKLSYNLLCSLKKLWIHCSPDMVFCGGKRDFLGFTSLTELVLEPRLVSSLVGHMGERKDDGIVEARLLPPSLESLSISQLPENLRSFVPEGLLYLKKLILSSPYLKSVQLHPCIALEELRIWGCEHLAVLDGLQFLTSLRILSMEMNPELSFAWELKLQEREQSGNPIQLLPPSLEKLCIQKLTDGVQSGLLTCFPTITRLAIRESPNLTSLQLGCCRALKELAIQNCVSLASMEGLQLCRNLTSLTVVNSPGVGSFLELVPHQQGGSEIWSGLEALEISDVSVLSVPLCKQLTSLRRLEFIPQFSEQPEIMVSLTGEQERALQLLTSLQELRFWMCPNLLSLPANLHSLTSLEILGIYDCKSITRLPDMGFPPSLRNLQLSNCSEELGARCRMAATERLSVGIDYQYVD
ncbi:hypothetical protein ACQ4PT_038368 [Festuca glaucescens]